MFPQLSNYLLQYRQVSIPGVGHFAVTLQPARLVITENLLQPPAYVVRYAQKDALIDHQLEYLARDLHTDISSAQRQLEDFGGQLAERLREGPLDWKGIGKLESTAGIIRFHPDVITIEGWQPVPVEIVVRGNPPHTILVGEREMQSAQVRELLQPQPAKKRGLKLQAPVAWILVLIAFIFLLVYLSIGDWQTTATGNRAGLNVEKPPVTYQSQ